MREDKRFYPHDLLININLSVAITYEIDAGLVCVRVTRLDLLFLGSV